MIHFVLDLEFIPISVNLCEDKVSIVPGTSGSQICQNYNPATVADIPVPSKVNCFRKF